MSLVYGVDKKAFSIAEDQSNKRYHLFLILVSYTLVTNQTVKIILETLAYGQVHSRFCTVFSGKYFSRDWGLTS